MGGKVGSRYDNAFTQRRIDLNMSISELSDALNIPANLLIRLEEGRCQDLPRNEAYIKSYCDAFGITPNRLEQDITEARRKGVTGTKGKPFIFTTEEDTSFLDGMVKYYEEKNKNIDVTESKTTEEERNLLDMEEQDKNNKAIEVLDKCYHCLDLQEFMYLLKMLKEEYKDQL